MKKEFEFYSSKILSNKLRLMFKELFFKEIEIYKSFLFVINQEEDPLAWLIFKSLKNENPKKFLDFKIKFNQKLKQEKIIKSRKLQRKALKKVKYRHEFVQLVCALFRSTNSKSYLLVAESAFYFQKYIF